MSLLNTIAFLGSITYSVPPMHSRKPRSNAYRCA